MKEYERSSSTPERLKEAMRAANMKQVDIASATGLSKGTISRYLSGEVEPRRDAVHKLAVALGVTEMWLYGYDVPRVRTAEQKKNDDLVQVIVKLRADPDFFEVVSMLASLQPDEYASIKQLLTALGGKQ